MEEAKIRIGAFYSNGEFGNRWAVRQVLTVYTGKEAGTAQVRYKVVVGEGRRKEFTCDWHAFEAWAKYEVARNDSTWERIMGPESLVPGP